MSNRPLIAPVAVTLALTLAAALAAAHATPAVAPAPVAAPVAAPPALSFSAIEQRLAAEGFRVLEIERHRNSVEVKGQDRAGQCLELRLEPRTGAVLRRERDDDCARGGERRSRR